MAILVDKEIKELVENEWITLDNKLKQGQIQPASLDLRVGDTAYRIAGSICPEQDQTKEEFLESVTMYKVPLETSGFLEKNAKYLIEIQEKFRLPEDTWAYANNKSSSGRINLQVKLISNNGYDTLSKGFDGYTFIEVTPNSFPVEIKKGDSLNQVRFFNSESVLDDSAVRRNWPRVGFYTSEGEQNSLENVVLSNGIVMHVDLSSEFAGYKAKNNPSEVINLSKKNYYDSSKFFDRLELERKKVVLQKGEFYVFSTKEFVRTPPEFAIEMIAYDLNTGEFRSHYAGFFDPGFGFGAEGEVLGTPATLEIIPHDNIVIKDNQAICKLIVDKCSQVPENPYGSGKLGSSYQFQRGPRLSKHFKQD